MSDLTKVLTFDDILNMFPDAEVVRIDKTDEFEDLSKLQVAPPPIKED